MNEANNVKNIKMLVGSGINPIPFSLTIISQHIHEIHKSHIIVLSLVIKFLFNDMAKAEKIKKILVKEITLDEVFIFSFSRIM